MTQYSDDLEAILIRRFVAASTALAIMPHYDGKIDQQRALVIGLGGVLGEWFDVQPVSVSATVHEIAA